MKRKLFPFALISIFFFMLVKPNETFSGASKGRPSLVSNRFTYTFPFYDYYKSSCPHKHNVLLFQMAFTRAKPAFFRKP